jgi:hypothetical protein
MISRMMKTSINFRKKRKRTSSRTTSPPRPFMMGLLTDVARRASGDPLDQLSLMARTTSLVTNGLSGVANDGLLG